MAKLIEKQVLLVKNESSYGVDPTPTPAANSLPIIEPATPEIDPQLIERGHPGNTLSKVKPLVGARATKMSFRVEYFGSGDAATPPRIGDLIEGCGFAETIASDVQYAPASANFKSNTLYQYIDGLLYKLFGAVGNFKMSMKGGEPLYFDFDKVGLYQDDADVAIVTPQYESNWKTPPQALSVSFTLDSITTFVLREFNIDMGIPIINRLDAQAATGYAGFQVGKRNPTGNIIVEGVTKATYDFLTKFKNATEVAATLTIGSVAGNRFEITMPKLTYTNVGIENQDGLMLLNIPISVNMQSGDDEITLKHN